MLSEKPWRVEAVLRFLLSIIIFVMLGSLLTAVIGFAGQTGHPHAWLFGALAAGSGLCCGAALTFLRRHWEVESMARDLGTFLLCLYLGLALGMFALKYTTAGTTDYSTWRVTIGTFSLDGSAILLTIPFAHKHGMKWAGAFGFDNNWQRALIRGVLVTIVFLPVGLILQNLSIELLSRVGHEAPPQTAVKALQASQGWLDCIALGVVTVVLAPIAEEMIFRGILYPTIKRFGFPRLAFWGTSLLFAAVHDSLPIFLPLLVLALALTVLYEKTDNLLAPIVAHGLFNAINFVMFYQGEGAGPGLPHHA